MIVINLAFGTECKAGKLFIQPHSIYNNLYHHVSLRPASCSVLKAATVAAVVTCVPTHYGLDWSQVWLTAMNYELLFPQWSMVSFFSEYTGNWVDFSNQKQLHDIDPRGDLCLEPEQLITFQLCVHTYSLLFTLLCCGRVRVYNLISQPCPLRLLHEIFRQKKDYLVSDIYHVNPDAKLPLTSTPTRLNSQILFFCAIIPRLNPFPSDFVLYFHSYCDQTLT